MWRVAAGVGGFGFDVVHPVFHPCSAKAGWILESNQRIRRQWLARRLDLPKRLVVVWIVHGAMNAMGSGSERKSQSQSIIPGGEAFVMFGFFCCGGRCAGSDSE